LVKKKYPNSQTLYVYVEELNIKLDELQIKFHNESNVPKKKNNAGHSPIRYVVFLLTEDENELSLLSDM
jgi:hypothetical protein